MATGRETSRATVVEAALRRELRRRLWEREVERLVATGDTYEDLPACLSLRSALRSRRT